MNCGRTQQIIRDAFDRGWEIDLSDPHLSACETCRAFLEDIQAIEASLEGVGLEPCPRGLADRIRARVAAERAPAKGAWPAAGLAAAALVAVSALAYWSQPGWTEFQTGLAQITESFPQEVWRWPEAPVPVSAVAAWESAQDLAGRARSLSGWATGAASSGLLALLILFNAGVALRLRNTGGPSNRTLSP